MLLYTQVQNPKGIIQVIAGQYFGIGCLVTLSILGALGTRFIPHQYIGLFGVLPIFLGVRSWSAYRNKENETEAKAEIGFLSISLLVIANGADNIGVYIPVFSGYSPADFMITILVFIIMIVLWCYLGFVLSNYPYIKNKIVRYQHILFPIVLISLGIVILVKNYIL